MKKQYNTNKYRTETVFGVPVNCCLPDHVLSENDKNIRNERKKRYISITNTESMYYAKRLPRHFEYINSATFSLCDGIGVLIAALFEGKRIWRFNGPVLMEKCCEYGIERQWRHFFYGGKEGVAKMLSEKFTNRFPGLIVSGTFYPPFRELTSAEEEEIIRLINDAKPDILWVGLGLLKQEAWIVKYIDRIDAPWMVGVGAAFDFHAGTVKRAPKLIRQIGMEWVHRLLFNFEFRLIRRLINSLMFTFQAIEHALFKKSINR